MNRFVILCAFVLVKSVVGEPCDGKTSGTDVIAGIEYNCVSAGHEAIACFANGESKKIGEKWQGEPLKNKPFEWICEKSGANTVSFSVVACFLDNGDRLEVGDSMKMENVGTYSCVKENGKITRKFEEPKECTYKGKTYEKDEIIETATGSLICSINSGGAKIKAKSCKAGPVTANINMVANVEGVPSKCVAQGENKDEMTFVPLQVADCNGRAIGEEWTQGNINKKCTLDGLKAVTEDVSCKRDGVDFKGIRKFGDNDFSQCALCGKDCDSSELKPVSDTECENKQELLSTWTTGDVKFRCALQSGVAVPTPIACLSGEKEINKGEKVKLSSDAKKGFVCELNDKDLLILRELSDAEFKAWQNSGGNSNQNNGEVSASGGEGTGEIDKSSTSSTTTKAPSPSSESSSSTKSAPQTSTTKKASPGPQPMTTKKSAPQPSETCVDEEPDCADLLLNSRNKCSYLTFRRAMLGSRKKRYASNSNQGNLMEWKTKNYGGSGRNEVYTGYKPLSSGAYSGYSGYQGARPAPAPRPSSSYSGYYKWKPQPAVPSPSNGGINNVHECSYSSYKQYKDSCKQTCGKC